MPPDPVDLVVLGGFLGAGKTTTLLRLADHSQRAGRRVVVIANDQGEMLADTQRFRSLGLTTAEVTGGCFCCRFDDFVHHADELIRTTRPDVILSEPVGSCTDLVATVLRPLRQFHGARFTVAPYTVLVDPVRLLDLFAGPRPARLSAKIAYIFRMQQEEAQCLAINKIDTLSADDRQEVESLLQQRLPHLPRLWCSARTGTGFDALANWLDQSDDRPHAVPDVDYDLYAAGEAELGWLNQTLRLYAPVAVDADEVLLAFARHVCQVCATRAIELAHAKMLLRVQDRTAVVQIVGNAGVPDLTQATGERGRDLDLVVNVRAQADPQAAAAALEDALSEWVQA